MKFRINIAPNGITVDTVCFFCVYYGLDCFFGRPYL